MRISSRGRILPVRTHKIALSIRDFFWVTARAMRAPTTGRGHSIGGSETILSLSRTFLKCHSISQALLGSAVYEFPSRLTQGPPPAERLHSRVYCDIDYPFVDPIRCSTATYSAINSIKVVQEHN